MDLSWLVDVCVMHVPWWSWPGLVPREAQGAPLTDIAVRPCFAGSWKVGGLEWSFILLSPPRFQELYILYFMVFV